MKNDPKPRIIVAQTHQYVLDGIVRQTGKNGPNEIAYEAKPLSALRRVVETPTDVLVTGQCFYENGPTTWNLEDKFFLELVKLMDQGRREGRISYLLNDLRIEAARALTRGEGLGAAFAYASARLQGDKVGLGASQVPIGNYLADLVHEISPATLIFRYSLHPIGHDSSFTGELKKECEKDGLPALLQSPDLADILKSKDSTRLVKAFPKIEFHKGWQQRHNWN